MSLSSLTINNLRKSIFEEKIKMVHDIDWILQRRSIRKYTSKNVDHARITALLKAAMAAPSASNRTPWHFVVINNRKQLDRLADTHPYGKMLYDAPLCIAVCGNTTTSELYWVQDCSAATENLLLAAVNLDLGAVWLGVFPRQERVNQVKNILQLPPQIIPLNLVSLGYPAEAKEARTQYSESHVHYNKW
jgi:nitroreductase